MHAKHRYSCGGGRSESEKSCLILSEKLTVCYMQYTYFRCFTRSLTTPLKKLQGVFWEIPIVFLVDYLFIEQDSIITKYLISKLTSYIDTLSKNFYLQHSFRIQFFRLKHSLCTTRSHITRKFSISTAPVDLMVSLQHSLYTQVTTY